MRKITYYSLVKEEHLRKTLFLGTLKALLGLILMFFSFIPGLLLIGWGLIPYRKLKKLQDHPEPLHLTEEHLIWKKDYIPLCTIERMEYFEGEKFGIILFLKERTLFLPYFSKRTFTELTESHLDSGLD